MERSASPDSFDDSFPNTPPPRTGNVSPPVSDDDVEILRNENLQPHVEDQLGQDVWKSLHFCVVDGSTRRTTITLAKQFTGRALNGGRSWLAEVGTHDWIFKDFNSKDGTEGDAAGALERLLGLSSSRLAEVPAGTLGFAEIRQASTYLEGPEESYRGDVGEFIDDLRFKQDIIDSDYLARWMPGKSIYCWNVVFECEPSLWCGESKFVLANWRRDGVTKKFVRFFLNEDKYFIQSSIVFIHDVNCRCPHETLCYVELDFNQAQYHLICDYPQPYVPTRVVDPYRVEHSLPFSYWKTFLSQCRDHATLV